MCGHPMREGKTCGRKPGHKGKHCSTESVARRYAYTAAWRKRNREHVSAYKRERYATNPEDRARTLARTSRWQRENDYNRERYRRDPQWRRKSYLNLKARQEGALWLKAKAKAASPVYQARKADLLARLNWSWDDDDA